MNKKMISILLLLFILLSISIVSAFSEDENKILNTKYDFYPSDFVFEYNGYNTSDYEGDTGLKGAYVNNTVDNYTYYVPVEYVRTFAWLTDSSFKLDDHIDVRHSLFVENRSYDCILLEMFNKDGSEIPKLDVKSDSLTKEQRSYFDDYEASREEYYQKQNQYTLEDFEDNTRRASSNKNSKSRFSYYYGSNYGRGVIYSP